MRLDKLKPDKRNARRHTDRNREMIAASIAGDGFGRSILLANDGTIIAGNATAEAAGQAGLDDVVVVETDGTKVVAVKRTDVAPDSPAFRRLALADNRTAELAEWGAEALSSLAEEVDLSAFWGDEELTALLDAARNDPSDSALAEIDTVPEQWMVLVECDGESQQAELLERFVAEGLRCRALTS